jgi:tyrosyl-tRNA synthetase
MIHDPELARLLGPLARTVETVIPEADLAKKLARGKPLRCKLGLDPTATSVHVGNGIQLWNLRRLQDLGHRAVVIIGDYTALIGDPSGKDKTRPMLTQELVEQNVRTWKQQISKILDPGRLEWRRNSEWFEKMPFLDVLRLSDRMTVQQMLERDSFEKRFSGGNPISIREFLYCLMQGWDSVEVKADVELGGTDQTFNLTVGRRLMEQVGLEPQACLIGPLVEGTDGQAKMSKSLGNSIGLTDEPRDMFGKAMCISDALLAKYLRLLTDLPDAEIDGLLAAGTNPRDAKLRLAEALVARYHGASEGTRQRDEFVRVISDGGMPSTIPEVSVPPGNHPVWDLVRRAGFAKTNSEARRLQFATFLRDGEGPARKAPTEEWDVRDGDVIQVGSHRFARLRTGPPS